MTRQAASPLRYSTKSALYYTQVLSLDICLGVVGSGAFVKTFLQAPMKPVWWFLLPACVWVVYTADHLMDARKIGERAVNVRHKFHFDHFLPLAALATGSALLCVSLAFFYLREIVFSGGLVMAGLAFFHIVMAYWGKVRFGKEISVAVIYSCGVWFAPFLNRVVTLSVAHIAAFVLFVLAALLNLFMNSVLEFSIDRREKQVFGLSLASQRNIRGMVMGVAFAAALGCLVFCIFSILTGLPRHLAWAYAYLALLCATPGIILVYEEFFLKNQRYRIPAEWVFAVGLIFLAVPR